MKQDNETFECPCYRICSELNVQIGRWCRYEKSDLPLPGTWRFDPQESWCPPGVRASLVMLASLLAKGESEPERLEQVLARVRDWMRDVSKTSGDNSYAKRDYNP